MTHKCRRRLLRAIAVLASSAVSVAGAATRPAAQRARAGPDDYLAILKQLRPGDTLELIPGEYAQGLPLHRLAGTAARPIVIQGPPQPGRAVFIGREGAHTLSLLDVEHVIVRDLVLDGRSARVDAVRAEAHGHWAHHVTLERLAIVNHGASQQTSGISTKCPAWGWVVRDCTIIGAGTGMYFGDSDGSDAFFDSLIEGNRVVDPVGYGIQIKHQRGRPEAVASGAVSSTLIRRNMIVKSRAASTAAMARPSLLVSHFPLAGAGAQDRYLVYGNLLLDNPSEALFQGEGNIAFYNNLVFNPRGDGVRIQPHNDRPREVAVFNNTIVAAGLGVGFRGGEAGYARLFEHNLVYGRPPVRSEVDGDNLTGDYDRARAVFARLEANPAKLDLTPLAAVPEPRSPIGAEWLALPGAALDYLGRLRDVAAFGACPRGGLEETACR